MAEFRVFAVSLNYFRRNSMFNGSEIHYFILKLNTPKTFDFAPMSVVILVQFLHKSQFIFVRFLETDLQICHYSCSILIILLYQKYVNNLNYIFYFKFCLYYIYEKTCRFHQYFLSDFLFNFQVILVNVIVSMMVYLNY